MLERSWSAKFLNGLVLPKGQTKLSLADPETKGLYFEVRAKSRSFVYRSRKKQRDISKTIGPFPEISIAEARHAARQLNSMPPENRGGPSGERGPTLDQFVDDFFVQFTRQRHKEWQSNLGLYRNHVSGPLGHLPLSSLTRAIVHRWGGDLVQKGLKSSTINRIGTLLGQILGLAEDLEVAGAPERKKVALRSLPVKQTHNVYLSPVEVHRLCRALQESANPDLSDIINLLLVTGARKNEVLQLRWSYLDPNFGFWTVPQSKNGKPRQIQLTDSAVQLLKKRQGLNGSSPFVFPNPETGRPYRCIHHSWDRARKEAGLPDLRVHDLRHSYASALVNAGVPLYDVQHLLGHSSIRTTQRYAHLSRERLSSSAKLIDKIYGQAQST